MKALHNFIKAKINTDLPAYQVEYYNSQWKATEKRMHEQMLYPFVGIEYIINNVNTLALRIKDMDLTIRFRLFYEDYTHERGDDMDLVTEFTNIIDGLRGNEADAVQFTSLEELAREIDEDHDMVNAPYIDYRTMYRNLEVYNRRTADKETVIPVTLDLTGGIT